jgi:hypothetical protein
MPNDDRAHFGQSCVRGSPRMGRVMAGISPLRDKIGVTSPKLPGMP